jgi:hypothetical protein
MIDHCECLNDRSMVYPSPSISKSPSPTPRSESYVQKWKQFAMQQTKGIISSKQGQEEKEHSPRDPYAQWSGMMKHARQSNRILTLLKESLCVTNVQATLFLFGEADGTVCASGSSSDIHRRSTAKGTHAKMLSVNAIES